MSRPKGLPKTGGRKPGTPNKANVDLRDAAREYTEAALQTLAEVMQDQNAAPAARVSASNALLDRGYGRPMQAVELSGADGKDLLPEMDPDRMALAILNVLGARPKPTLPEPPDPPPHPEPGSKSDPED